LRRERGKEKKRHVSHLLLSYKKKKKRKKEKNGSLKKEKRKATTPTYDYTYRDKDGRRGSFGFLFDERGKEKKRKRGLTDGGEKISSSLSVSRGDEREKANRPQLPEMRKGKNTTRKPIIASSILSP